jgi:hypothetical protein
MDMDMDMEVAVDTKPYRGALPHPARPLTGANRAMKEYEDVGFYIGLLQIHIYIYILAEKICAELSKYFNA